MIPLVNDLEGYFTFLLCKTPDVQKLRDIMYGDKRLSIL